MTCAWSRRAPVTATRQTNLFNLCETLNALLTDKRPRVPKLHVLHYCTAELVKHTLSQLGQPTTLHARTLHTGVCPASPVDAHTLHTGTTTGVCPASPVHAHTLHTGTTTGVCPASPVHAHTHSIQARLQVGALHHLCTHTHSIQARLQVCALHHLCTITASHQHTGTARVVKATDSFTCSYIYKHVTGFVFPAFTHSSLTSGSLSAYKQPWNGKKPAQKTISNIMRTATHRLQVISCQTIWQMTLSQIFCFSQQMLFFSMLWHCWLGVRKSIWSEKIEWLAASVVICLEGGANDLHMVQLILLPPHRLLLH